MHKLSGSLGLLVGAILLSGHASGQMPPPPDWSAVETLIRTDGSLGPGTPQTLSAETALPRVFVIGEELGSSFGQNLFHSFENFDLGAGDTAKFTASRPFSSVVSRVTGPAPSYLNGQIRSDISGADFYFLNPSGVFFGPGASLDVPGAFYASTADDLEFSDGRVFSARPGNDPPLLSMANPAAFGFFGQAPIGRILVDESNLRMAPGQALTLVGGDIEISGGAQGVLRAPGGTVSLLAVASAGKARFDANDPSAGIDSLSFASLGAIELNELAWIDTRNYGSDSNGDPEIIAFGPSGDVFLTADSVRLLEFSLINTRSFLIGGSGNVNIEAGDYIQDSSDIRTDAYQLGSFRDFGEGNAGNVRILASRSARLVDSGISASIFVLDPDDSPTSSAGTIEIRVGEGPHTVTANAPPAQPDLRLSNTEIQIVNQGSGSGGALELSAEELVIESGSLLGSLSTGTGAAGAVSLLGRRSIALHDSGISAGSEGAGASGEIRLTAPDIGLAGNGLLFSSTSGSGHGTRVGLVGERIRLTGGFGISTINSSLGPGAGAGADIEIQASESLLLEDVGLFSATFGDGDAGNITISGNGMTNPDVSILGGEIGALAFAESGPTVGNAGNISVRARTLSMDASPNRLTLVNAGTATTENLGQGGDIVLEIDERIDISSGAGISNGVWGQGEGGAVRVTSPNATMTVEGSIDTSSFVSAPAGSIEIDVKSLEIRNGGVLAAFANDEGAGGGIDIRASEIVSVVGEELEPGNGAPPLRSTLVTTTAGTADAGSITITAPRVRVAEGGQLLAGSEAEGRAGSIAIVASKSVEISGRSRITTEASGVGAAGSIFVQTPRLTLDDASINSSSGGTIADSVLYSDLGDGSVFFDLEHFLDTGEAELRALGVPLPPDPTPDQLLSIARTLGGLPPTATLDEVREFFFPGSVILPGGDASLEFLRSAVGGAGTIDINVGDLALINGGNIQAGTSDGPGGSIIVRASGSVSLSGRSETGTIIDTHFPNQNRTVHESFIQAGTDGIGDAGTVNITTPNLFLDEGAVITAETLGVGAAGDVNINAQQLTARGASEIRSESVGTTAALVKFYGPDGLDALGFRPEFADLLTDPGAAGTVRITAQRVELSEGSRVSVFAEAGAEPPAGLPPAGQPSQGLADGNIAIAARDLLLLEGGSRIEASVGSGLGGSITIGGTVQKGTLEDPSPNAGAREFFQATAPTQGVVLRGGSAILARATPSEATGGRQARAAGRAAGEPLTARGGDIEISANAVLLCPDCVINADGPNTSSGGSVVINNPETAIESQVAPPKASYLDASDRLMARCGGPSDGDARAAGRFTVSDWPAIPFASDGPMFALETWLGPAKVPAHPKIAARSGQPSDSYEVAMRASPETMRSGEGAEDSGEFHRSASVAPDAGATTDALGGPGASDHPVGAQGKGAASLEQTVEQARAALAADEPEETARLLSLARKALDQADAPPRQRSALLIAIGQTEAARSQQDPTGRRGALRAAHADLLKADREAEEQGDLRTASYATGNLGALYRLEDGREQEALRLTRRAIFLADEAGAGDLLARWYAQLGEINRRAGQTDRALVAYRRAVGLLEETRPEASAARGGNRAAFRQAVEPVYLALVDLLLQSDAVLSESSFSEQERLVEARNVVEQWKAAELRNYFRDRCAAEVERLSLESVDSNAAVVYPIALPDRLELLVSRKAGIARFSVPIPRSTLDAEAAEFRNLLTKRVTREYKRPARKLYSWLVKPYLTLLQEENIDTLIFVPSGALRTIPMAALHDGDRFLLENYSLAVTPSLNLLAPKALDPRKSDILLVGLSEAVQGHPALPGVPAELASIEALYGGRILLNDAFDPEQLESALVNSPPGILHIASHAKFTGNPDTSFVLTHNDRLSMEELSSLVRRGQYGDHPVELLILSACETAVGDERAALGLAGVAIRAGARSAMGSLWSVSDEATSLLTVNFYRALGSPDASKAHALQRAQLQLMADPAFEHPFYWAPFLLINNWL